MMIRSFLPVGQGAFYLEQFMVNGDRINVIYDCGSNTDIKLVEDQIKDIFKKSEEIHAVFLSHLDEDHINGLPFLLKYCEVKNIFFPLLTEENRILLQRKYLTGDSSRNTGDFFRRFLSNPDNAINDLQLENRPRLFQISEFESNQRNNMDVSIVNSGENVSKFIFEKECTIANEWLYIPFNFRQESRCKQLKEALKEELCGDYNNDRLLFQLCSDYNNDQLLSYLKRDNSDIVKIRNAYRRVRGDFNTNSMTLFSGMCNDTVVQLLRHFNIPCDHYCCRSSANGCLYTGDYDASSYWKRRELHQAYQQYLNYIGCVQVPHHGSRHNYNSELANIGNCKWYVISAGYKNQYRHPSASVLKDLLINNVYPHIVNEHVGSSLVFEINC